MIAYHASSIPEFITSVLEIVGQWERNWRRRKGCENESLEVWFRGHGRRSYRLVPGAYRGDVADPASAFHRFRAMGAPYLTPRPMTEWEWYFAAQHYGIPTRLLDWTDDPLVALQFAILSNRFEKGDPPVVWLMEAGSLNALNFGDDQVYVPSGRAVGSMRSWLPSEVEEREAPCEQSAMPAAILPPWATSRILAQRGRFTVHGTERMPLDECFRNAEDVERRGHIAAIALARPAEIAKALRKLGFALHRLFPEPEKLAEHIRGF